MNLRPVHPGATWLGRRS